MCYDIYRSKQKVWRNTKSLLGEEKMEKMHFEEGEYLWELPDGKQSIN